MSPSFGSCPGPDQAMCLMQRTCGAPATMSSSTRPDPSDGAARHVFSRGPKSFVKQLTIVDRALLTPGPALDDAAKRIVGGLGRFL